MSDFADIRPYDDNEVPSVLKRLLADNEFIEVITSLKAGPWCTIFGWFLYPLVRFLLTQQLKRVSTVMDFQLLVKTYMDKMVEATTSGFTVSGLDQLDPTKTYLFVSNHRDIALDPAFVNYALYLSGYDTVRIAIGDNLLTKPYISDLMRINKSFIVRRSTKGPRQILAAYKLLSTYIRHSINADSTSIWIAQREGRAKNGIDRTEPAIIKMFSMSKLKPESFSDCINALRIVPVAISYELDPCDGAKSLELYKKSTSGNYLKAEHEDVESIAKGITGDKGNVHVSFGTPLAGEFENADVVAEMIDCQIINNYVLHPTNFFAYKMLHKVYPQDVHSSSQQSFSVNGLEEQERAFQQRMDALPTEYRNYALGIYANPVDSKRQLFDQSKVK